MSYTTHRVSAPSLLHWATACTFLDGRTTRTWRYRSAPERGDLPLDPDTLLKALRVSSDRQLLGDVPVGLLFSGGLDSTLLLHLMVDHFGTDGLNALTAGYDASSQKLEFVPDDASYARQVARDLDQVRLIEVEIGADSEHDLDALSPRFDDPVADPAAITLNRLRRASDNKVLISGVGGEGFWAGYPRHMNLHRARTAATLPRRCAVPWRSPLHCYTAPDPVPLTERDAISRSLFEPSGMNALRITGE